MRSPALVSRSSNPERHAVLALLSERYPPLKGRSPTCYSPVRHSVTTTPCGAAVTAFDLHVLGTPPALILSQDQTLKLKCLLTAAIHQARLASRGFTVAACDLQQKACGSFALSNINGSSASAACAASARRRWLILDGLVTSFHRIFEPRRSKPPGRRSGKTKVCARSI